MSTPDPKGATPPELNGLQGHVPAPNNALNLPTKAPTPGLSGAVLRVPGGPTLPEWDPNSMAVLLARAATELYRAPPTEAPSAAQVDQSPELLSTPPVTGVQGPPSGVPSGTVPSTANAPSAPGGGVHSGGNLPSGDIVPSQAAAPSSARVPSLEPAAPATPAVPSSPGVPAAPTTASPFSQAPNFDSLFAAPAMPSFELGSMQIPLLDAEPPREAPAPAAPAPSPTVVALEPERHGYVFRESPGVFDAHALKREFPILEQRVNGKRLVWLDNAATTQKPRAVIDRIKKFYEEENSNIHRAAHTLAARATDAYEGARESVRRFLNAPSAKNIVFVRGTTEGINLVAQSWGRQHVKAGDEILISWLEHHANIVPWQQLCAQVGAQLKVAPVDDQGQIILEEYEKLLSPKTRLVAITQVSNALGTVTPTKKMVELARRRGARVMVDGAQAVSHMRVDVQALDADFYVFSGHKIFGPTGIGAVFGKTDALEESPPWQGGGNMIQDVTFERTRYHPPPARFEAGTGNIADAVGLGAALDWLSRVGIENVGRYEHELLEYATPRLLEVPGLTLFGTAPDKAGVLSFVLAGHKTEEVGGLLDKEGIAVRSGHHCAQPILRRMGVEATVRASLAPYNTTEDIDALVAALHRLQEGR